MAYMNLKTFDIYNKVSDNVMDKFVEVDELIAPIISLLNKKGYLTDFCCSGHPFIDYIVDEDIAEYTDDGDWDAPWLEDNLAAFNNDPYIYGYIRFKPGILLFSCPKDSRLECTYNGGTIPQYQIDYQYDNIDTHIGDCAAMTMYSIINDMMNKWMKWAIDLPEYNPMNSLAVAASYVSRTSDNFSVDAFIDALEYFGKGSKNESQGDIDS